MYCIPCVYLICNVHLCMHSYSCLHVGFRVISYLESFSQLSSKVTIQREASRYMPAAISAYKEALRCFISSLYFRYSFVCVFFFFGFFLMLKGVTTQTVHGSNAIVLYSYSLGGGGGGGGGGGERQKCQGHVTHRTLTYLFEQKL